MLTLATREQHIRRETRHEQHLHQTRGCSPLALAIRVSLLGKRGFIEVSRACLAKATYLRRRILMLEGYEAGFEDAPFFNEFAIRVRGGRAADVAAKLETQGILAGLDLGRVDPELSDRLLIAVTETHRREDLDRLVDALDGA